CLENYIEAKGIYLNLKNYFENVGMYDVSGKYYSRERLMNERVLFLEKKYFKWFGSILNHYLSGFGEFPLLVLCWWFGIICLFGFIFWKSRGLVFDNGNLVSDLLNSFYFSIVTFTTLGFGDIHPESILVKILASTEALIGAFMMALFVVTFSRKMLR
ncbi:MAG: potassium channel family protein, partial [bacterium]|nr:potassium channel family protein [bacterium]